MFDLYRKLRDILDSRERKLAYVVLGLTMIFAAIEVLGVASIMPFMAVLSNPELIQTNSFLSFVFELLSFESEQAFLFFLGVCVLLILVGTTFLKAFVVYVQIYHIHIRNYTISTRVVSSYLNRPYQWFLQNNSSELASTIIEEVSRVVNGTLYPAIRVVSNGMIALFLLILLVIVDPALSFGIAVFLLLVYGIVIKMAGKHLSKKGSNVSVAQQERVKVAQEAFGAIKDIKIGQLEMNFIERYQKPAYEKARNDISSKLWGEMPSFGMQAIIFGGMMVVILYLMKSRSSMEDIIPVLALYALAGYKLMPAMQEIYIQLTEIKYHKPALDTIHERIDIIKPIEFFTSHQNESDALGVKQSFELKDIDFIYPGAETKSITDLSFKIEKNSTVGFVGGSGSGKTTTIDIILGLLKPDSGDVIVDGQKLDQATMPSWQKSIGYVPQQIFLSDSSISSNIAFGIPADQIDFEAVEFASKTAHLHEFVINELPEQYSTIVGERGIRLSGGQRQRIGIARALYHDPDILIFDEATSALDNITEKAVMDAVTELGHKKTILLIAHRLSTVQSCDKIYLLNKGRVEESGTYDELLTSSAYFRELAHVSTHVSDK